jgi:hypothetical protein
MGNGRPRPGQTPATILQVMCVAAQARRRGGRGSEELDAGLARHLPRLWRRLGGCLERRKQGRALGSWPVRRRSLGQERRSSRATQEGQIFPGLARYHVAPAVAASSSQPAGSARPARITAAPDRHDHPGIRHRRRRSWVTAIGRSTVLPTIIRLRLLAGHAIVMKNPLEQLSRLRQSRAFGPQFDRVLAQDPIVTPNALLQSHLT